MGYIALAHRLFHSIAFAGTQHYAVVEDSSKPAIFARRHMNCKIHLQRSRRRVHTAREGIELTMLMAYIQ